MRFPCKASCPMHGRILRHLWVSPRRGNTWVVIERFAISWCSILVGKREVAKGRWDILLSLFFSLSFFSWVLTDVVNTTAQRDEPGVDLATRNGPHG